jgi:hypothetical protein
MISKETLLADLKYWPKIYLEVFGKTIKNSNLAPLEYNSRALSLN